MGTSTVKERLLAIRKHAEKLSGEPAGAGGRADAYGRIAQVHINAATILLLGDRNLLKLRSLDSACIFLSYTSTQGDPPVLKIVRRVNFGTGRKFGTERSKTLRRGLRMLVFLG